MKIATVVVGIAVYAIPLVVYFVADSVGRQVGHKYLFRLGWVVFLVLFIVFAVKVVFPWVDRRE